MARRKLGLGGPIKPSEVVERVQVDRASDRRLSDDEKDFDLDVHLHDDQEDKSTLPRRPHAPTGEAKDVLDALGDDALESLTTNLTDERPWLGELPPEMATGPTVGAPAETVEKLRPDQLSPPAGPAPPPTSQPPIAGLPPAASQDLPPSPPTSALELPSEMATGPTVGAPAETVEKLRPDQLSPPAGPAPPPTSQPPIAGLPPAASQDLPPSPPTSALELPSEMATGPTVGGHSPDLPPSDSTALPPVEAQDLPTGPEPEKPLAVGGVPAVDQAAGKTAFAADPLEGSAEAPPAHDSEVAERNRDPESVDAHTGEPREPTAVGLDSAYPRLRPSGLADWP